jgi:adenylosuccinate synthase
MLTVIVGGFFGDEGKGKIAGYLALTKKYNYAVRTGSINAGHTVVYNSKMYRLRTLSAGFVNKSAKLLIPPGALIKLDVFFHEVEELGVRGRVHIDYNTGVIEEDHVAREREDLVLRAIGSTFQGVGVATADRVLRKLRVAREFDELREFLADVSFMVNEALDRGEKVLVEGTQGTYLSLYHGTYPYVTSRDTTASGILSEVGIGPKRVDNVLVVFKAYVTRVGGGPLEGELSVEELEKRGWLERGSVTGRLRRAAPFNYKLAERAIMLNSATCIAITKIDALFPTARRVKSWDALPRETREWVEEVESKLKRPVVLIGTGEYIEDVVDRSRDAGVEL